MLQYAGMAMQLMVALAASVFGGMWLDEKIHRDKPLLIWLLPVAVLLGMLVKVVRDTASKK